MNDGNQRKKGVVLSYVALTVNLIVQLLYTPVLVRTLGQNEYGLYSLVANIINYLTLLDFGFGSAIVVYTTKYRAEKKFDEEKKLHGTFAIVFHIISFIALVLGLILFFNVENMFSASMTSTEIHKMKIMMLIIQ